MIRIIRQVSFLMFLLVALTIMPVTSFINFHYTYATTVTSYALPTYLDTSSTFSVTAAGLNVPVQKFSDYHIARFSYSGLTDIELTVHGETISSYSISPHSLNISGVVDGRKLAFSINDAENTPYYLVVQINDLEKLVILADPPETDVPADSGTGIYNIVNPPYNADSTGSTFSTKALQNAINDASSAGGGIVYVPDGIYYVNDDKSVIDIKSNVSIYLEAGAVLKASTDINDYTVKVDSNGKEYLDPMIEYTGSNIRIYGRGVIDASGLALMNYDTLNRRHRAIKGDNKSLKNNFAVEGVTFLDATAWTLVPRYTETVSVKNVKVLNHKNVDQYKIMNDGINISSCSHAVVDQCFVMTVDDAMCSKAQESGYNMSDVRFTNNVLFTSAAGNKAGMQARGEMSDIWFINNDIIQARRGIVVESKTGTSTMEGIHFINIRVEYTRTTSAGETRRIELKAKTASFENIEITNVHYEDKATGTPNFETVYPNSIDTVTIKGLYYGSTLINTISEADIETSGDVTNVTFSQYIATPTLEPTDTPEPTYTPTPVPTDTPTLTPAPTDTPAPTPTPKLINLSDIKGHWAEVDINKLVASGAVEGYPDGSFKPNINITRAEFVTILVKAFNLEAKTGKVFNDTSDNWAKDYISTANAYGIVSGYSETTFGPNDFITREQMAVMIVKSAKLTEESGDTSFADNESISYWAKGAVTAAKNSGIINGYPDNTFKPGNNATRAEAATVIVRALN